MENKRFVKSAFFQRLSQVQHIACIDAGGSKTIFQLFQKDGSVIPVLQEKLSCNLLKGKSANLTTSSKEKVLEHFQEMFLHTSLQEAPLHQTLSSTLLLCGAAGIDREEARSALTEILCEMGFSKENIVLCSDADLVLELLGEEGVILICGTGSICLGKNGSQVERCGGLGRFLGDEGSGHWIGMEAVKAVLAVEYGWGDPTSLTSILHAHFAKDSVKFLISSINKAEIPTSEIAALASLVLEEARKNDPISLRILEKACEQLASLIETVLTRLSVREAPIYLQGGVFRSSLFCDCLEKKLMQKKISRENLVNISDREITQLIISEFLRKQ